MFKFLRKFVRFHFLALLTVLLLLSRVFAQSSWDPDQGLIKRVDGLDRALKGLTGVILPFAGDTGPDGWELCDGRALRREGKYNELWKVIGVRFGEGDGKATFNLPDFRGRFLRGVDGTAKRDPDVEERGAMAQGGATGNAVGSVQSWATARPGTNFKTDDPGDHAHPGSPWLGIKNKRLTPDPIGAKDLRKDGDTGSGGKHSHEIVGGGDNETRPRNAYVNFIIKY